MNKQYNGNRTVIVRVNVGEERQVCIAHHVYNGS